MKKILLSLCSLVIAFNAGAETLKQEIERLNKELTADSKARVSKEFEELFSGAENAVLENEKELISKWETSQDKISVDPYFSSSSYSEPGKKLKKQQIEQMYLARKLNSTGTLKQIHNYGGNWPLAASLYENTIYEYEDNVSTGDFIEYKKNGRIEIYGDNCIVSGLFENGLYKYRQTEFNSLILKHGKIKYQLYFINITQLVEKKLCSLTQVSVLQDNSIIHPICKPANNNVFAYGKFKVTHLYNDYYRIEKNNSSYIGKLFAFTEAKPETNNPLAISIDENSDDGKSKVELINYNLSLFNINENNENFSKSFDKIKPSKSDVELIQKYFSRQNLLVEQNKKFYQYEEPELMNKKRLLDSISVSEKKSKEKDLSNLPEELQKIAKKHKGISEWHLFIPAQETYIQNLIVFNDGTYIFDILQEKLSPLPVDFKIEYLGWSDFYKISYSYKLDGDNSTKNISGVYKYVGSIKE